MGQSWKIWEANVKSSMKFKEANLLKKSNGGWGDKKTEVFHKIALQLVKESTALFQWKKWLYYPRKKEEISRTFVNFSRGLYGERDRIDQKFYN